MVRALCSVQFKDKVSMGVVAEKSGHLCSQREELLQNCSVFLGTRTTKAEDPRLRAQH